MLDPAALDLVVAVAVFRLAAIDHEIMEQVVVAGDLPDLRVHDDRAVQADHFVGRRGAGRNHQLVVAGDHVPPPGLADVPLQLHAHRPVVPKALQAAVNLARLEEKSAPLAQRDQLVHFHGCNPKSISRVRKVLTIGSKFSSRFGLSASGLETGILPPALSARPLPAPPSADPPALAIGEKVNVTGVGRFRERKVTRRMACRRRRGFRRSGGENPKRLLRGMPNSGIGSAAGPKAQEFAICRPGRFGKVKRFFTAAHVGPCNTTGVDQPARHEGYRPSGQAPTCQGGRRSPVSGMHFYEGAIPCHGCAGLF